MFKLADNTKNLNNLIPSGTSMLEDGLSLQGLIHLGADNSIKELNVPVLLLRCQTDKSVPILYDTPLPGNPLLDTEVFSNSEEALQQYISPTTLLIPLQKTDRNNYPHFITLGRASNNDLIIADKTISKTHGWFALPKEGEHLWRFVDNGSTNGSLVNNVKIPPKKAIFIQAGDQLQLGNIQMLFITGEDAYNLCKYIKAEWKQPGQEIPICNKSDTIKVAHAPRNSPFQKISL